MFFFVYSATSFISVNSSSVEIYPCGKGMTVLAKCDNEVNVVSCGGDSKSKYDVLEKLHLTADNINLLVVPSVSNTEVRYANDILSEFDVNSILLYYMSSTKEETYNLAMECNNYFDFSKDEIFEIELGYNMAQVVINVDNHTYQYIYNNDKSMLLIPLYGDCREIPERYRQADVVVICDKPDNFPLLDYKNVVWSSDERVPEDIDNVISVRNEPIEIFY